MARMLRALEDLTVLCTRESAMGNRSTACPVIGILSEKSKWNRAYAPRTAVAGRGFFVGAR